MEKPNEFLKKHYQKISFLLVNSILVLTILLFVNLSAILELNILSSKTLLYTIISSGLLIILLKQEYSDIDSKEKDLFKCYSKIFFLASLLLQVIYTNDLHISITLLKSISIILTNYSPIIDFLFYASGIFLLLIHRKEIRNTTVSVFEKKNLDNTYIKDRSDGNNNRDGKKSLDKYLNIKNKTSLLLLLLILIGFTVIKAPYFDHNFAGGHAIKYNAYVEPAKYMAEQNDFTWYQLKYLAHPITNPEGIQETLPQLPLLQWSLASTFKLLPNNSLEVNTRLVMHTIGLITLVFLFLLVKKWTNNTYALIATTLMAFNSVFNLSSFVTVYDTLLLMFFLISLYLLSLYRENNKNLLLLTVAGLITGIGISTKISLLLWTIPATFILIFLQRKKLHKKVFDFLIYYLFAGFVYILTKYSIPDLPTNLNKGLFILLFGILFIFIFYELLRRFRKNIEIFLETLEKRKLLIPLSILFVSIIGYLGMNMFVSESLVEQFLTDKRLIFSIPLYEHMLIKQFIPYVTRNIFTLSVLGLFSLFLVKDKRTKIINIVFLTTSIFFWVVASKSIFVHNYYTLLMMLSFILLASCFVYSLLGLFKDKEFVLLLVILLEFFVLPHPIRDSKAYLSIDTPGFEEAAKYLEENTQPDELYIDESHIMSLTLETGRARIGFVYMFYDEEFKETVRDLGFKGAMDMYNVKYLITRSDTPSYDEYVDIFTEEDLGPRLTVREDTILRVATPDDYLEYVERDNREELINKYNIREKFVFEKEIGVYRFFRFEN
jgi:4-amino-4-deoxy-L-arabinose transferase-like glycosyltransferase